MKDLLTKLKGKTVKIALVAVALQMLVVLIIWSDVYLFEDGSVWTTLPTEALAVQRIESQGTDFRAYEFTLRTEPWTCVFAAGETKGGLFCVPRTSNTSILSE